jgi:hypothetical protein
MGCREESEEGESMTKLLDKFKKMRQKKVDVRSEPFQKKVVELLMANGLQPINARVCALELIIYWWDYNRKLGKSKKDATDEMVKELGDNLLKTLAHNGITDPEQQDSILCQYFDYLNEATGNA